jgi:hypothetical protein
LNNFNYIMAVESSDMSTNTQCIWVHTLMYKNM